MYAVGALKQYKQNEIEHAANSLEKMDEKHLFFFSQNYV